MTRFTVLLTPDFESDGYTVSVPALPGRVTDGEDVDDALNRASGTIPLYLRGEDEATLAAAANRAEVLIASVEIAGAA